MHKSKIKGGVVMVIEVLGMGCPKCRALKENVEKALRELKIEAEVREVKDVVEISKYGVALTPALVIDGKVVSSGKVLSSEEIEEILKK
mgnify:CR=1 FL=1